MFRGLSSFFKDLKFGVSYLFSFFRRKEKPRELITLSEKTLKNVNQALLEDRNKWMGKAVDLEAKHKRLFRETMKKVEVNPTELLEEQYQNFINDIMKRGHKMTLKKGLDVYTKDLRFNLGKFKCFSVCDGYWYLIYHKGENKLGYLKAPSMEELISYSDALANQINHNLLITNFIFVKGKLTRVPTRVEEYV